MGYLKTLTTGLAAASVASAGNAPLHQGFQQKQFEQTFYDGYNLLKYTGGLGPYSDRQSYGIDRNPPAGCEVDQVFMLMRHGERYPDWFSAEPFVKVLDKMSHSKVKTWAGDLAFFKDWTYYVPDSNLYSQESTTGPYAGLLNGYHRGSEYRSRYGNLWDGKSIVPIFASGYERVIETARKFGEGFFGYNYSTNAAINIIPEDASWGANSLTPSCAADTGLLACYFQPRTSPQFEVAAHRFNSQNPGLKLNSTDIFALMEMAAFELNVRPSTPWMNAFTMDEWVAFGYIQDLQYYYCAGPGNPNQIAVGQVYANATLSLLVAGPKEGSMFWSFSHDANITPVVAALGIDIPDQHLPNNTIPFPHTYHVTDIVPMGGHLVLERLTCSATAISQPGHFVRAVINEAVVPWSSCQSGPGYSCPLSEYAALVKRIPHFDNVCKTPAAYPQHLSFFWDYNTTTAHNYQRGPIASQLAATDS
ncbi:acid phosphatase pho5 [Aspergillus nanangensis]|uniref:3-phytase n=1 Tax=Aspergillus nanangensis TaxID=2582783 RepID=A0AAD4CCD3_ASPNN|nr:acid phosphatase pho5 [Aspergillus nanangensis]